MLTEEFRCRPDAYEAIQNALYELEDVMDLQLDTVAAREGFEKAKRALSYLRSF